MAKSSFDDDKWEDIKLQTYSLREGLELKNQVIQVFKLKILVTSLVFIPGSFIGHLLDFEIGVNFRK